MLVVRTSSCWLYHPTYEHLRDKFWETFYKSIWYLSDDDQRAIEIGRLFGLFRTYGFDRRPEKDNATPLKDGDQELVCLEAFCLR